MKRSLLEYILLWDSLGKISVSGDAIEEPFLHFSAGTDRFDIWAWFESECPEFSAAVAIGGGYGERLFPAIAFTSGADTLFDGCYINRIYLSDSSNDSNQDRKKLRLTVCKQLQESIWVYYRHRGCFDQFEVFSFSDGGIINIGVKNTSSTAPFPDDISGRITCPQKITCAMSSQTARTVIYEALGTLPIYNNLP